MKRPKPNRTRQGPHQPGRAYSLVVTTLATLLIGLTVAAYQNRDAEGQSATGPVVTLNKADLIDTADPDPASHSNAETVEVAQPDSVNASPAQKPSLAQLKRIAGIALALGLLTCVIPRRQTVEVAAKPVTSIADLTGLPQLASLFPVDKASDPVKPRRPARLLPAVVMLAEIAICLAALVVTYGCASDAAIARTMKRDPLDAYSQAVQLSARHVHDLLNPAPRSTS